MATHPGTSNRVRTDLLQQFETMMTQSPHIAKRNNPKYAMQVGEESGSIMGHSVEVLRHCNPQKSYHHYPIDYFTMQEMSMEGSNQSPYSRIEDTETDP